MKTAHYRSVWLSDIHLGNKDCKADYLLDFLRHSQMDTLYLVGDIVDMWAMSRRFSWPSSHNDVLHAILTLSKQGTKVIYLPGNHDAPLQKYDGMGFGEVEIHREFVHTTAKGERLLLLHGDQFDDDVCFGPLHAWIGDKAYDFLLFMNRWYNHTRGWLNYSYWSLAGYIKQHINGANKAIQRYREACCNRARECSLMALYAVTFIIRKLWILTASVTAMMAIGSKIAQLWWSMNPANWNWCTGHLSQQPIRILSNNLFKPM